ncbi:MAG: photosynthetic complex putative assembly protein PuhB [Gemmatimonadaceae bacterium]
MATSLADLDLAARTYVHGVNEPLPPGEQLLWEGAPQPAALAKHLLFVRPLAVYFALMIAWWAVANRATVTSGAFWITLGMQAALTGAVIAGALALARWIASSTTYAISDKRIVVRLGIIFPLTVNIPLHYIVSAKTRSFADGTGEIALELDPKERLAWIVLFPHVRLFRFSQPEPLLRGLKDPAHVGAVLTKAALERQA